MEPSEIEFLAEETVVTVVPNFNCRKTYLITGELGPFRAGIPLKVPLWLAADLKRRQKCRIVPPAWMDLEKLEKLRDEEAESPRFCEMPSEYYIVEAKIILSLGIEDNPSLIPIMSVIKDIWDRRMAKLATSVNVFMHLGGDFVRIPNLTPPELNIIRPILPNAMDFLSRLGGEQENPENAENAEGGGRTGHSEMREVLSGTYSWRQEAEVRGGPSAGTREKKSQKVSYWEGQLVLGFSMKVTHKIHQRNVYMKKSKINILKRPERHFKVKQFYMSCSFRLSTEINHQNPKNLNIWM